MEALATKLDDIHRLLKGDRVAISGATYPQYNGFFEITDVPAANQFKYTMLSVPAGDLGFGPKVQWVWGVDRIVVENNVVELTDLVSGEWGAPTRGVAVLDSITGQALLPTPPPYVHGQILVRNNHVRHIDGRMEPSFVAVGVQIASAKSVIVENNVIDVVSTNPVVMLRCGSARFFNNSNSAGALIQGYNNDTMRKCDELETQIADAFILAF